MEGVALGPKLGFILGIIDGLGLGLGLDDAVGAMEEEGVRSSPSQSSYPSQS